MRTHGYRAALVWTIVMTAVPLMASEAAVELSNTSQIEEKSIASTEEYDCSVQRGIFLMEETLVEDITLDYHGQALLLGFKGRPNDGLKIFGFDRRFPYVELGRFEFLNASLCTEDLIARGFVLIGTDESEIILGTNAPDRIRGKRGNDTLDGANGDDVYTFEAGDGIDCIRDPSGRTTIAFGTGIAPRALSMAWAHSAEPTLYLRFLPANGTSLRQGLNIRLSSQAQSSRTVVEFADGSIFTLADLQSVTNPDRLNPDVLTNEQACYFDSQDAARAGLVDKRSTTAGPPPLPPPAPAPQRLQLRKL